MKIQSVLGPIDKADLGICSAHEHIFIDLTTFYEKRPIEGTEHPEREKVSMERLGILSRDPYALRDNLIYDDFETQKKEILRFRQAGGRTVFDATTNGIGRAPKLLRRIAKETGLHVVLGAGYYVGSTFSKSFKAKGVDEIAGEILTELNEGVNGTDIRAGYIGEIGISERMDECERKVLKASGVAQKETGVALSVHINPWTTNGLPATQLLIEDGIRPERIVVCHVDVQNRLDYILELLDRGVYVEFDNFGKEYQVRKEVRNAGYGVFASDKDRVKLLRELIDRGYERQLLLACDVCLKINLRKYGGYGYDHVLTNILPMMREEGILEKTIERLLIANPADCFCGRE